MSTEVRRPDAAQLARIEAFESWLHALLRQKQAEQSLGLLRAHVNEAVTTEPNPFSIVLAESPFAADLERHLSEFLAFPAAVQCLPNPAQSPWHERDLPDAAQDLVFHELRRIGADYAFDLMTERLRWMIANPGSDAEMSEPGWARQERALINAELAEPGRQSAWVEKQFDLNRALEPRSFAFLEPKPPELARMVLLLARRPEQALRVLDWILGVDVPRLPDPFEARVDAKDNAHFAGQPVSAYLRLARYAWQMQPELERLGLSSPERLRALLRAEPAEDPYLLAALLRPNSELSGYRNIGLDWMFEQLEEDADLFSRRVAECDPHLWERQGSLIGGRFLELAAGLLQRLVFVPRTHRQLDGDWDADAREKWAGKALRVLTSIRALDAGETESSLVDAMRGYPEPIRRRLFAHSGTHRALFVDALGLSAAKPLFLWLDAQRRQDINAVFDATTLARHLADAGEAAAPLLALMGETDLFDLILQRVAAVRGGVDKKFRGMLNRLSQEHIRLYGLIPLRDDADLIERYRFFRQAPKDAAKKFGFERTANVRDAARAGLENLARTAGFADVAELEWSVDARSGLAESTTLAAQQGAYALSIRIDAHKPVLEVSKDGKLLKSVPPPLKKHAELTAFFASFDTLKDQAKRYRSSIENLMIQGRWLGLDNLADLRRSPVADSMLRSLVFRDEQGHSGLLSDAPGEFRSVSGEVFAAARVQIAHAVQLLRDGSLAGWQQHIVGAGILQIFKQVFRECYVPTPAELEAGLESRRFALRSVKTNVTGALLATRGWRVEGSEFDFVARRQFGEDLVGELELPEVYHFLSEQETTALGAIRFRRGAQPTAIADLPAIPFSEFMRDVDLVITAAAADSDVPSAESIQARVMLLSSLLPALRLGNVRIESPHAFIDGKRAKYQLHLGTAVIHILPAGYLCVVPAADAAKGKSGLALPHVDDDARTREVLSKIVLLAADQRIKDPSILAQIERQV